MPWTTTANVAQYEGSNWANYVKTVSNCSPAQAMLIVFQDPSITYFFYCREPIILTNGRRGLLQRHAEAVVGQRAAMRRLSAAVPSSGIRRDRRGVDAGRAGPDL